MPNSTSIQSLSSFFTMTPNETTSINWRDTLLQIDDTMKQVILYMDVSNEDLQFSNFLIFLPFLSASIYFLPPPSYQPSFLIYLLSLSLSFLSSISFLFSLCYQSSVFIYLSYLTNFPMQCVNFNKFKAYESEEVLVTKSMELYDSNSFWAGYILDILFYLQAWVSYPICS